MSVRKLRFVTKEQEYLWVAGEIKKLSDQGVALQDIAVIARQHKTLQALLPFLEREGLPVAYEQGKNVLEDPIIQQLLQCLRFVNSIGRNDLKTADELLPEILNYPFLGIPVTDIWLLSVYTYGRPTLERSWLLSMLQAEQVRVGDLGLTEVHKLKALAVFLIQVGGLSRYSPVEVVLDMLLGVEDSLLEEDTVEEVEESLSQDQQLVSSEMGLDSELPGLAGMDGVESLDGALEFKFPFKSYYFDAPEVLASKKLDFLSNLRVLVAKIREFQGKRTLLVGEVLALVDMLESNNLALLNNGLSVSGLEAVQCLTAHKSKGLEFEVVFVLSCVEEEWIGSKKGSLLSFPKNLPLNPEPDNLDDKLRLFYVAITRCKRYLYLTAYQILSGKKSATDLRFLDTQGWEQVAVDLEGESRILHLGVTSTDKYRLDVDQRKLLAQRLEGYQLSVTHLQNFLDVTRGGPMSFLEQNLLQFPKRKPAQASFGTAMHASLRWLYREWVLVGGLPDLASLLQAFERYLSEQRLSGAEFGQYLELGRTHLSIYYAQRQNFWNPESLLERNFLRQGVVVGEAHLTGQIDKMDLNKSDGEILVTDFKTGKPHTSFTGKNSTDQLKLWKYRQQLVFYKILVEKSRDFGGKYHVNQGVIEFLKPTDKGGVILLQTDISQSEAQELELLIQAVYSCIQRLEFPDVSQYSLDLKGVRNFVDDLVSGKF